MEWNGEGRDCGMLKIAVVEDQQEVRDELCRFIRQYAAENSLQVEVLSIEDGAVIAEHYEPGYDIIFMDVEMPGLDGFGAAEKIRAVDVDAVLVFVTNMAQYAIKGLRGGRTGLCPQAGELLPVLHQALTGCSAGAAPPGRAGRFTAGRRRDAGALYWRHLLSRDP